MMHCEVSSVTNGFLPKGLVVLAVNEMRYGKTVGYEDLSKVVPCRDISIITCLDM
jgi:hypothetical protein